MRRFWTHASLSPTEAGQQLMLDDKPMRLPEGGLLVIAPPALAAAIRDEWQQAGLDKKDKEFGHEALPLTQLHTTAHHRVATQRDGIVAALAAYGESDLLCYRAGSPQLLRDRQNAGWQPWLDWAATTLNAPLLVTTGVTHIAQPPASLAALTTALDRATHEELAALGVIVPATGSLVLGLALIHGALDAPQTFALATIDDQYQREFWGEDSEATLRLLNLSQDIALAARFVALGRE